MQKELTEVKRFQKVLGATFFWNTLYTELVLEVGFEVM